MSDSLRPNLLNPSLRITIFGGTFDPIHNDHVQILHDAREEYELGLVYVIPSGSPWQKSNQELASPKDRLAMCELAFKDYPDIVISDIEINRIGPSYTLDTVRAIKALHPKTEKVNLLIGSDTFNNLPSWIGYQELVKEASLIVALRPKVAPDPFLVAQLQPLIISKEMGILSSTEIRKMISQRYTGSSIDNSIERTLFKRMPEDVAMYILKHGVYQGMPEI
jgi:nicotinate-nucleotide adenylyltransferase